jgi:hypothetical protein
MEGDHRLAIGRPRRSLAIFLGLCAIAALTGCQGSPNAEKAAAPTQGAMVMVKSVTVTMPESRSATKPAVGSTSTSRPVKPSPSPSAATTAAAGSTAGGDARPGATQSSSAVPGATQSSAGTGTGTAACVTSAAQFNCGPYQYPEIQGVSSDPTVGNNVWNPISGWQQTLYANSPGDWWVVANMPAGNTAVVSYPSSQALFNNEPLSNFKELQSSFSETMNATSQTSAWATYDIWLTNSGTADEIMIQHDFANNGACTSVATATFDGQSWYLCDFSSMLAWKLPGDEQSGSVDVLAMLTWLEDHGYISTSSELNALDYGWEIASTGGQPETFTVSDYSITSS